MQYIIYILSVFLLCNYSNAQNSQPKMTPHIPIQLTKKELDYYKIQPKEKQTELFQLMKRMSTLSLTDGDVPPKFKVLELPIPDYVKSNVIKKITAVEEMGSDSGESYKLRSWVDAFLRIPFGKIIPLPVCLENGEAKCTSVG